MRTPDGVWRPSFWDYPASGDLQVPTAPSLQLMYVAGYVQDDWRVTERLTLNIGFRYDLETPYTERYNRISYFDPGATSAATKLVPTAVGGLAFPGVNGLSRYRQDMNWVRPGSTIGAAYKATNSLVLRAAYGISIRRAWPRVTTRLCSVISRGLAIRPSYPAPMAA